LEDSPRTTMDDRDASAEELLVRRAKAGDETALISLFDRHAPRLKRRIRSRLSPAVRRKVSDSDVLQETWMAVARHLDDFEYRGQGSFVAWAGTIAENAARKQMRRQAGTAKRAAGTEVTRGLRKETLHHAGIGPSPSAAAMGREMRERVRRSMDALPDSYRTVIELLQHRRVTIAEAAELMGRSPNAVKKLHARALAELAKHVGLRRGADDGAS
jgi:RNA polymerase sigma-70 factor (ECF subfamily)